MAEKSVLEILFAEQVRTAKLPAPARQHVFHETRRWKFDFAWPDVTSKRMEDCLDPIAVEVEGGTWIGGRHNRGKAFEQDCEKYAEALIRGWRVLRVTTDMVYDGRAIALLRRLFDA